MFGYPQATPMYRILIQGLPIKLFDHNIQYTERVKKVFCMKWLIVYTLITSYILIIDYQVINYFKNNISRKIYTSQNI